MTQTSLVMCTKQVRTSVVVLLRVRHRGKSLGVRKVLKEQAFMRALNWGSYPFSVIYWVWIRMVKATFPNALT